MIRVLIVDDERLIRNGLQRHFPWQEHHMEVLGGTGTGFILAPAHTVQPDVPVENIVALYEEVHR